MHIVYSLTYSLTYSITYSITRMFLGGFSRFYYLTFWRIIPVDVHPDGETDILDGDFLQAVFPKMELTMPSISANT